MQLDTVTDADHGSMPCAAQTSTQLPQRRAIVRCDGGRRNIQRARLLSRTAGQRMRWRGMELRLRGAEAQLHVGTLRTRKRKLD